MKKFILSTAAVVLGASAVFAQAKKTPLQSHLSLGPVVSFGHSWVSNMAGDGAFKASPALGIGLVYSKNEHWGFGAQLLASHEGYKRKMNTLPGDEGTRVSVNPVYVRLPVHAIYFFGKYGDRVRPKIYAGPSVAVRVDEKAWIEGESVTPNGDVFRRADFGLSAGAGANIRLSKLTWLNLDAGYYHGLVDVLAANNGEFNGNRNLRLNVGLMWGL